MIAIDDDEHADLLGGAVGGIAREDIPRIVANLVTGREQELELWIRPDRAGYGYAVEWTKLDDRVESTWRPHRNGSRSDSDSTGTIGEQGSQLLSRLTSMLSERMPRFDVDRERISLFAVDDRYLFKQYFDQEDLFGELRRFYNQDDYRFEMPEDAIDDVTELMEEHFYDPVVIDDPAEFCVVYPRYSDHPDVLFKASVLQCSRENYHVFLMKDQLSVDPAVNTGATPLAESELEFFP